MPRQQAVKVCLRDVFGFEVFFTADEADLADFCSRLSARRIPGDMLVSA